MFKDPCEGCLVQPICNQMCEEVTEFYKKTVRKRTKSEVELATGYFWEDDYVDENGAVLNKGGVIRKIDDNYPKQTEVEEKSPPKKKPFFKKIFELLKKENKL